MKYTIKPFIFTKLICVVLLFGCCNKEDDPCQNETPSHDQILYAEYFYNIGTNPSLNFDLSKSSHEINIKEKPQVVLTPDSRIDLIYSGITIRNNKTVYKIDDALLQVKTSTCWIDDKENNFSFTFSKSLDIVLALDVSSSLGSNIVEIKKGASNMISNILKNNPNARIAVVKYSRGSVIEPFSSNESRLIQFITNNSTYFDMQNNTTYTLEGKSETALYESINVAIDLLKQSGADGQGILTFTDGVSNFQVDPKFQDEVEVIDSLKKSNISHYTIGYEGNGNSVDKLILEKLAWNGNFSFPKDNSQLQDVFIRFSNSVAAVYDFKYNTNNGNLEKPKQQRFLFNTTVVSQ